MPRTQTRIMTVQAGGEKVPVWHTVLTFEDGPVVDRTLRVRTRALSNGEVPESEEISLAQGLIAGIWWGAEPWVKTTNFLGALRLQYGTDEGIVRDVFCDLREGEFNLPPCNVVTVQSAYYDPENYGEDRSLYPIEVACAIVDGDSIESTPLVLCAQCDGSSLVTIPPGAYAFDISNGVYEVSASSTFGLYVYRNPGAGGRYAPPTTPILLGPTQELYVSAPMGGRPLITFFVR